LILRSRRNGHPLSGVSVGLIEHLYRFPEVSKAALYAALVRCKAAQPFRVKDPDQSGRSPIENMK